MTTDSKITVEQVDNKWVATQGEDSCSGETAVEAVKQLTDKTPPIRSGEQIATPEAIANFPKTVLPTANHWNGHRMCAIDLETTGLNPRRHEIVQIAVIPVTHDLVIDKTVMPFVAIIKPE